MKHYALVLVAIAILLLAMPSQLFAVSANPNPISTKQPDGTELTVRIFGDEWYHSYETEDGYAIMQKDDGWWVYADLDASGRYTPSQFRVNKSTPGLESFLNSKGKHLKEDEKYRIESREKFLKKTMPGILEEAKRLGKAKGLLNINVPVILIQYPDNFASQTRQSFDDMMNLNNYNGTGSFRNYYQQVSYNNLTVTATVVGWYTAPQNRSYYAWSTGNPTCYNRARQLVRSGVDAAEAAGMNFANFDNDGDGNVDVVFTVHQGPGAEGGNNAFVWSHASYLNPGGGSSNLSVTYDGRLIDRYIIMPEISSISAGQHIEIGVFCHEFGHVLGLPDLYDIKNPPTSEGVGLWDLMGSGSWGGNQTTPQLPTHMSTWCKSQQGWITPTNVTVNTMGQVIPPVENNATAFRLWTNGAAGPQYFLVELRKKTGFDINLPTEGLAIWHIDDSKTDAWGRPTNQDENYKAVDLEEADGLNDLDNQVNRGDAGDLFPGSFNNLNFNDGTNPNSKDYGGGNTLVQVNNIASGASYTADLYVQVFVPPPDLVIRDCASDIGNEPDNQCFNNWVQSPDIWVDNNDDNIIDEPVKGQVNHLYIRSWNISGTTTNAEVRCWYVDPSMGLRFPGTGTQIIDAVTYESYKTIPVMGTTSLPPADPTGYRVYFNWLIPTPPPDIGHYCIGCVISNPADPQVSQVPLQENNLGQINYWALALKKGQMPFGLMAAGLDTVTIFREKVRVNNPLDNALLTEGFEGVFPPTGWTRIQSNTGYESGHPCFWSQMTYAHSGSYSAGLWWSYYDQDEWLITPEFTLAGVCSLTFWTHGYEGSIYGDHYWVKISTNGGASWDVVFDLSALSGHTSNDFAYPYKIGLDAYAGQNVKIAWHAYGVGGIWYPWLIDDVLVESYAPRSFVVTYGYVPPGWSVTIDNPGPFYLMPDSFRTVTIDVTRAFPQHRDSATIGFQLRTWPDTTRLVGGLWHDYRIDDVPPAIPLNFEVHRYQLLGNDFPRPCPTVELTWYNPGVDTLGFPEKVNYYKIYRSRNPDFEPNDSTLVASTALDRDLFRPGYQWWDYANITDTNYYYAVLAVDKAGSPGIPTPPKPVWQCGDVIEDGVINLSDVVYLARYILSGWPAPVSMWACNVDGAEGVTLTDVIWLARYVFGIPGFPLNCV